MWFYALDPEGGLEFLKFSFLVKLKIIAFKYVLWDNLYSILAPQASSIVAVVVVFYIYYYFILYVIIISRFLLLFVDGTAERKEYFFLFCVINLYTLPYVCFQKKKKNSNQLPFLTLNIPLSNREAQNSCKAYVHNF